MTLMRKSLLSKLLMLRKTINFPIMAAFFYAVALSMWLSFYVEAQVTNDDFDASQDQARGFRDSCHDASTVRPNIVMIMLDDLGFGDISATTGQFPTPNMDSLYLNGIQLSHHYVHLMCSPSRTQFITGRYAMNLGFGEFLPWNNLEAGGIPIGQPTLANWLSEYGDYTTYGVGKWHMGTYNIAYHWYSTESLISPNIPNAQSLSDAPLNSSEWANASSAFC